MALYSISDLHLPLGVNKPMDVFGASWENYVYRLRENWKNVVTEADTVVLPGDFSWAMRLSEAQSDFEYLSALPGIKILLKGNHDYWWDTISKLERFMDEKFFTGIYFLQNNAYLYHDTAICGTRFWVCPGAKPFTQEDERIYLRELGRAELSLQAAQGRQPEEIIFFTHYPPLLKAQEPDERFMTLMHRYGVKRVVYGHIHGNAKQIAFTGVYDGIEFDLVSCDYLQFIPRKLKD